MRRMRRFFAALFVLVLFGTGVVCIPVQGARVRTVAAETRDPYRPVEVQSYTWGNFDVIHIMRTYRLSPIDDPAGIPTKDFEEGGWVYHMVEMRRDFNLHNEHLKQFEGTTKERAEKLNDSYLKLFSDAGIQAYGQVTDYLVAEYLQSK